MVYLVKKYLLESVSGKVFFFIIHYYYYKISLIWQVLCISSER